MPELPVKMKMSEVPGYLERNHAIQVTRQTVYNWARHGRRGVRLKTEKKAGVEYTTTTWVNNYVALL